METQIQVEQYWTVEEVAKRLRSSVPSVRRWVGQKRLKKTKAGSRTLISETSLQNFLRESTAEDAA